MDKSVKMLVVTDAAGKIVAAARRGASSVKGQSLAIKPLPGQTVHEVDVPEPVTRLSGRDFHLLLSQSRFEHGAAKLTFPSIRVKKAAHPKD